MNDSLIKQLELAIQVEKGELEWTDTECRRKNIEQWEAPIVRCLKDGQIKPVWNFESFEYRRKPKPLECWFLIYIDQSAKLFTSMEGAQKARDKEKNSYLPPTKIVHMKEVL